ncbi:MAG: hypothetical protein RR406_02570 [Bacilli bacterium]
MIGVLPANLFFELLVQLAAAIDSMIFSLVSLMMGLLMDVSKITISLDLINNFASRVYVVLGIFMLFKLTINLLNVVVNPEALNDKENGTSKIVVKIVIALIMLLAVQPVFKLAIDMQASIVRTIPSLLLGTSSGQGGNNSGSNVKYMGESIAAQTFKAFITPAEACQTEAENILSQDSLNGPQLTITNVANLVSINCPSNSGAFMFKYMFGFSGITGLFLAFVLLTYCVDIAVRVIKLAILQLLAPIPIISYADPKASKKSFSSWIKMCGTAYIDLFIKLAIIYFVIFLLGQLLAGTGFVNSDGSKIGGLVSILLVIGIFFFAKQAPQYIADIFGIKVEQGGSFLGKAMGMVGAGAGFLGGAALGGITGTAGGAITGVMQTKSLKGGWEGAKAGLANGAAGGLQGGMKGANQYRKQSNDIAQKLTGDDSYQTGIRGGVTRNLKNAAKGGQQSLEQEYDNIGNKVLAPYAGQIDAEADNIASQDSGYQAYQNQYSDLSMQGNKNDADFKTFRASSQNLSPSDKKEAYQNLINKRADIKKQMGQVSLERDAYKTKVKNSPETQAEAKEKVIEGTTELKDNKYVAAGRKREESKAKKGQKDIMTDALKEIQKGMKK